MNGLERFQISKCKCGKQHQTAIEHICIEQGAIHRLEGIIENKFEHIVVIADKNTQQVGVGQVEDILDRLQVTYTSKIFQDEHLIPDEKALGEIFVSVSPCTDLIVVVGSGTLNDLGRFASYQLGIPYIIVGTAPSMDGFASKACPLIINHLKTTLHTHSPLAIIGDIDLLKTAPYEMLVAGVGDLLGKYTCLCDWKISHIINDEYYCEEIAKLVKTAVKQCEEAIDTYGIRSEDALQKLMEALVLSGLCMEFVESSRPASGAEHHVSHFWEMMFMQQGKPQILHGMKVGVATMYITKLYNALLAYPIDWDKIERYLQEDEIDHTAWCEKINKVYGEAAKEVIALEEKALKNDSIKRKERVQCLMDKWQEVMTCIEETVPKVSQLQSILERIEAPQCAENIGVDGKELEEGLLYAKELRDRYTVLQLVWDIGMMKEIVEAII